MTIKRVNLEADGTFTGTFSSTLSVGEKVDTGYGEAKVARILDSKTYTALGTGATYEEQSANAYTAYYYSIAIEGELTVPTHIAALVYDLNPGLGENPPEGEEE